MGFLRKKSFRAASSASDVSVSDVAPSDISASDIFPASEMCSLSDVSECCSHVVVCEGPTGSTTTNAVEPTSEQVGCRARMGRKIPQPAMMSISSLHGAKTMVKQLEVLEEAAIAKAISSISDWSIHTSANQTILAKAGAITSLIPLLSFPSPLVQERALRALHSLAVGHNQNKTAITNAGALTPLIPLLNSPHPAVQHQAIATLDTLTLGNYPNQTAVAKAGGIFPLIILLSSESEQLQQQAASALSSLAVGHSANRTTIVDMGGIPPLISVLRSPSVAVQEQAVQAVRSLTVDCDPDHVAITECNEGVPALVSLLDSASETVQQYAAAVLWNLTLGGNPANQMSVVHAGAIAPLVKLLESPCVLVQQHAAGVLWNISVDNPTVQDAIVDAGAIQPLISMLQCRSASAQEVAAATIGSLAAGNTLNQATIADGGAIPPLIPLLQHSSAAVQQHAARALGSLAAGHESNRTTVASAGAIPPLVSLLSSTFSVVQHESTAALGSLAWMHAENQGLAVKAGAVSALVHLLHKGGSTSVQGAAAGVLAKLAYSVADHRVAIMQAGALPHLMTLLKLDNTYTMQTAAECLMAVACSNAEHAVRIQEACAVPRLQQVVKDQTCVCKTALYAMGALCILMDAPEDEHQKRQYIGRIVDWLSAADASDGFKESAAAALMVIAQDSFSNMETIKRAGAVPVLEQLRSRPAVQPAAVAALRAIKAVLPARVAIIIPDDIITSPSKPLPFGSTRRQTDRPDCRLGLDLPTARFFSPDRPRYSRVSPRYSPDSLDRPRYSRVSPRYSPERPRSSLDRPKRVSDSPGQNSPDSAQHEPWFSPDKPQKSPNASHRSLSFSPDSTQHALRFLPDLPQNSPTSSHRSLSFSPDTPKRVSDRPHYSPGSPDSPRPSPRSSPALLNHVLQLLGPKDPFHTHTASGEAARYPPITPPPTPSHPGPSPTPSPGAQSAGADVNATSFLPSTTIPGAQWAGADVDATSFLPSTTSPGAQWAGPDINATSFLPSTTSRRHAFDHSSKPNTPEEPGTIFNYSGTMSLELLWALVPDAGSKSLSIRISSTVASLDPSKLAPILATAVSDVRKLCGAVLVCKVQATHLEERLTMLKPFMDELGMFVRSMRTEKLVKKLLPCADQMYMALQAAKKMLQELPRENGRVVQFMKKVFVADGLVKEFKQASNWLADVVEALTVCLGGTHLTMSLGGQQMPGLEAASTLDWSAWHHQSEEDHDKDVRELANQVLEAFGRDIRSLHRQLAQEHLDLQMWIKHVGAMGTDTRAITAALPVEGSETLKGGAKDGVRDELREFLSALENLYLRGKRLDPDDAPPDLPPFCIPVDAIEDEDSELIGVGGFGHVYKATYQGCPVAVKVFANNKAMGKATRRRIVMEAFIMSRIRGPSVVQFYGVIVDPLKGPWDMALVTEFIEGDSLFDRIHDEWEDVSEVQSVRWCLQAAQSVKYLHDMPKPYGPIVHGDIKTSNFLVSEHNDMVKMIDFGCATVSKATRRLLTTTTSTTSKSCTAPDSDHSVLYTAPEMWQCIRDEREMQRTTQSDVYALGMLFYEVCTRSIPFENWGWSSGQIEQGVCAGKRPPLGQLKEVPSLVEVIQMCWAQDPADRASLDWVCKRLQQILKQLR